MRIVVLVLIIYCQPVYGHTAQDRKDSVIYFNGFFRSELDPERIQYYGIPKKIKDKLYEVDFYTLDTMLVATGEYKRKNCKRRNGVFVLYNSVGKIIVTANYRKGTLNGVYQKFYDSGLLSDSGKINRGNFIGLWKSWHFNGQPKEIRFYEMAKGIRGIQFSILTNEYKSYFINGALKDSGYFRNNRKQGVWVELLENGSVRSVGEYKHGWRKGSWRFYDKNGKLLYLRRYNSLKYDDVGERIEIK